MFATQNYSSSFLPDEPLQPRNFTPHESPSPAADKNHNQFDSSCQQESVGAFKQDQNSSLIEFEQFEQILQSARVTARRICMDQACQTNSVPCCESVGTSTALKIVHHVETSISQLDCDNTSQSDRSINVAEANTSAIPLEMCDQNTSALHLLLQDEQTSIDLETKSMGVEA